MLDTKLPDITTEEDVRLFVDEFYARVIKDDLVGPVFNDVAKVNWGEHLPVMYSFWSAMLLGTRGYKRQPFPPHAALRPHITPAHFARWVEMFHATIDTHFAGEIAETAKTRALNIAFIFQNKLAMIPHAGPTP